CFGKVVEPGEAQTHWKVVLIELKVIFQELVMFFDLVFDRFIVQRLIARLYQFSVLRIENVLMLKDIKSLLLNKFRDLVIDQNILQDFLRRNNFVLDTEGRYFLRQLLEDLWPGALGLDEVCKILFILLS